MRESSSRCRACSSMKSFCASSRPCSFSLVLGAWPPGDASSPLPNRRFSHISRPILSRTELTSKRLRKGRGELRMPLSQGIAHVAPEGRPTDSSSSYGPSSLGCSGGSPKGSRPAPGVGASRCLVAVAATAAARVESDHDDHGCQDGECAADPECASRKWHLHPLSLGSTSPPRYRIPVFIDP